MESVTSPRGQYQPDRVLAGAECALAASKGSLEEFPPCRSLASMTHRG